MIYIILSVLAATAVIVTFKLFDKYGIDTLIAISVNYIFAACIGYFSAFGSFSLSSIPDRPWFIFSLIIGVAFFLGFYLFGMSARHAGVAITAIFSRSSLIIPVILGFIVFSDEINIQKIIGIVIALLAFYLTFKRDTKVSISSRFIYFPLLLLLLVGTNHFLMKYAQYYYIGDDFKLFMATAFFGALITSLIVNIANNLKKKFRFTFRNIIGGIVLGSFNWIATYNFLRGLDVYDLSFFVPLYNVSVVVLSSFVGFIFFKEKMRLINWIGVLIASLAIVLLAIG